MKSVDIAALGAGVAGTNLAWHLSQSGRSGALFERETVEAGASGRNAGSLIPPFDPRLTPYFEEALGQASMVAAAREGVTPLSMSGLLALTLDEYRARSATSALSLPRPELKPKGLAAGEPSRLEPEVVAQIVGVYIAKAHTVDPLAVTRSFANTAVASGVELIEHVSASVVYQAGRVVDAGSESRACDSAIVCPSTQLGDALPVVLAERIGTVWGVVASRLRPTPPHAILIEADGFLPNAENATHALPDADSSAVVGFGLVKRGELSAFGHSLGAQLPNGATPVAQLVVSSQRYLPRVRAASVLATRVCARPTRSPRRRHGTGDRRFLSDDRTRFPQSVDRTATARALSDWLIGRSELSPMFAQAHSV